MNYYSLDKLIDITSTVQMAIIVRSARLNLRIYEERAFESYPMQTKDLLYGL